MEHTNEHCKLPSKASECFNFDIDIHLQLDLRLILFEYPSSLNTLNTSSSLILAFRALLSSFTGHHHGRYAGMFYVQTAISSASAVDS